MTTQQRKTICIIEDAAGIKRGFGSFKQICDTYLFNYNKYKRKPLPLEIDGYDIYRVSYREKHLMDMEHVGGVAVGVLRENLKQIDGNDIMNFKLTYRASEERWNIKAYLNNSNWVPQDKIPDLKDVLDIINSSIGSTFKLLEKHCYEFDDKFTQISFTLIS